MSRDWLALFLFQTDMLMCDAKFTSAERQSCLESMARAMA